MRFIRFFILAVGLLGLAACSGSKFRTYNGPEVTQIVVMKEARTLYLVSNGKELKRYKFDLGFAPVGDKKVEGDGKTPEGAYFIDRRNPKSRFHLSVGISYPNQFDRAEAEALGQSPGGDIFIHGRGPFYKKKSNRKKDWTWGCIAVSDKEIEEIYSMVNNGTQIVIHP
ncbi:L,D-transpeptidase family protein [Oceaniglobus ichthyenteri]|uniref:L,D-transpeptidase family protein n=1 Tax=Oceaniglobus ichthyenteri TaxID=2136177 RepID=UPI000D3BA7D8|nr:L,D-transpeptidase family protein [Oceaniglobus ichthyenteri]